MSDLIDRSNDSLSAGTERTTTARTGTGASMMSLSAEGAGSRSAPAAAAATMTMTMTPAQEPQTQISNNEEVLRLTLQDRPAVTWDESVIDNEGMGRKSSKRCCIFHKQRAFGESSTDTSDSDNDNDDDKKIAYKKKPGKKKTPDHLRFHA